MENFTNYFNQSPRTHHYALSAVLMLMVALGVMQATFGTDGGFVHAANPTMSLAASATPTEGKSGTITVTLDATNEGAGLLGAEAHINYDANVIEVTGISYGTCSFDSCIDLTSSGTIKLLAASATVANGGKAVTTKGTFATISANFLAQASTELSFGKCQVITNDETVSDRTCNKIQVSIAAAPTNILPVLPVCGNGKVETGEACDDGNQSNSDACTTTCTVITATLNPVCGNGKVETGEVCDDGNQNNADSCTNACSTGATVPPVCGNGKVETGETCDDSNQTAGDGCSATCSTETIGLPPLPPACGNGKVETGEVCDDGNQNNSDACTNACKLGVTDTPVCGNGTKEGSEQCDDGNNANGDGCNASCSTEVVETPQTLERIDAYSCCGTTLEIGDSIQMNSWAYFNKDTNEFKSPYNVTSKVTYATNNAAVAGLSAHVVTAKSAGTAIITATYTFNGVTKTDTETIKVKAPAVVNPTPTPTPTPVPETPVTPTPPTPPATDNGTTQPPSGDTGNTGNTDSGTGATVGGATGTETGTGNTTDSGSASTVAATTDANNTENNPPAENPSTNNTSSVRPAAPVVPTTPEAPKIDQVKAEKTAVGKADEVIRDKEVVHKVATVIEAPKQVAQVDQALQQCRARYPETDFSSADDQDGDGLSNKTECYGRTNPTRYDTDADSCSDGAEINILSTNPNDPKDCGKANEPEEEKVFITDPHAGWTLRTLEVAGIAPAKAVYVTAVAYPTERKLLQAVLDNADAFIGADSRESAKAALDTLNQAAIPELESFFANYAADYNYDALTANTETLKAQTAALTERFDALKDAELEQAKADINGSLASLRPLVPSPVTVGTANILSDAEVSGKLAKSFSVSNASLTDSKVYDLVAIATLSDESTVSSAPVRFSLDESVRVGAPKPRSIGSVSITDGPSAFNNLFIGNVRADSLVDGVELSIDEVRPTVSGDTEFGTQVFAVWHSLVLASSVISDSEAGAFAVEAPQDLETDIGHRVTLYAVKTGENGQARSESVNVFFRIKPPFAPLAFVKTYQETFAVAAIILALGSTALVLVRRRKLPAIEIVPESHESAAEAAKAFETMELPADAAPVVTAEPTMVGPVPNEPLPAREAASVFMQSEAENPLDADGLEKREMEKPGFFARLFHRKPAVIEIVPESHEPAAEAAEAFENGIPWEDAVEPESAEETARAEALAMKQEVSPAASSLEQELDEAFRTLETPRAETPATPADPVTHG